MSRSNNSTNPFINSSLVIAPTHHSPGSTIIATNEQLPNDPPDEIQLQEFRTHPHNHPGQLENNNVGGGGKNNKVITTAGGHHPHHVHFDGHDGEGKNGHRQAESHSGLSSEDDEDDDNIHFSKSSIAKNQNTNHGHPQQRTIDDDYDSNAISELPPLTNFSVTPADIWFNGITCLFCMFGLILDTTLVFWHYNTGHMWGSGLTALVVGVGGGVSVLKRFWGVSPDKLDRLYGERAKCVRILVNGVPWLGTIITSYMTTSTSHKARTNPMQIHHYIQLQDWCRMLLRVQSLAQAAPQAALQLLLLIEGMDGQNKEFVGDWKATTMSLCIITSLTNMMIANLPSKSDVVTLDNEQYHHEQLHPSHKAAYSPYSRLFIGLRMMSSFASRTMTLSLFLSSFRCTTHLHTKSFLTSHLIPLSILILPRISFTLIDYIHSKFITKRPRRSAPQSFSSTLLTYTASIFFTFGEPRWIFWYITIESVLFIGVGAGLAVWGECVSISFGVCYVIVFIVLFGVVPIAVPCCLRWGRVKMDAQRGRGAWGEVEGAGNGGV